MSDGMVALLAAIVKQAAFDWHTRQDQAAGAFLAAAGMLERAAMIYEVAQGRQARAA